MPVELHGSLFGGWVRIPLPPCPAARRAERSTTFVTALFHRGLGPPATIGSTMSSNHYDVIQESGAAPIKLWTRGVPLEDAARQQLQNIARLPFIHRWIAVMPAVHLGKGATVGSVVPTSGAIIPAAVGVDIGCGMIAARTTLMADDLPDNLGELRSASERAVPHGRTVGRGKRDKGAWDTPPQRSVEGWSALADDFKRITERHPRLKNTNNLNHLGTLGTGNHFVEVCLDEEGRV